MAKQRFVAKIRLPKGCWQHLSFGSTAREAKRSLAKKVGLPVRVVDPLPLGKSPVKAGSWSQVVVEPVR
jgi:hypothetical protein